MNPYWLEFAYHHSYYLEDEITVPISITSGDYYADVSAKLDTGSKYCVLQPDYADLLELDLTAGVPQKLRTATGTFYAYGHEVIVSVFDLSWHATVYFAESENFPVNVVGRIGFLDQLRIALIDYDQVLYASRYEAQ